MVFQRAVLCTAVTSVAFCKKPEIHTPDEELFSYWMGEDLPAAGSKDGLFAFNLDFLYDLQSTLPILPTFAIPVGLGITSIVGALILAAVVTYFGNAYLTKQWMNTWDEAGIPSPPCSTILGNSLQIKKMGGLRASLRNWSEEYGKVFGIHMGRQPVLVVADALLAEEILENIEEAFNDRYDVPRVLQKELGEKCSFLTHGSQRESLHYILTTAFCPTNLTYMIHRLSRCASNLAEYIEDTANDEANVNKRHSLKEMITSYSYDTLAAMILGVEPDHYDNPDDGEFFKVMKATMDTVDTEFCGVSVPRKLRRLKKFFQEKMKERKKPPRKEGMVDFLEIFMHCGGSATSYSATGLKLPLYTMAADEIAGTLTHWVLHGHETLISCLQFIFRVLATFPDYQQIVLAEIENNIQSDEPTYEELCNLPFLDLVIKEVLRMFAPVQEIWRYANRFSTVQEFSIPDRSAILIAVNLIHADADYFFEPESFEPERYFHDSNKKSSSVATSDVFLSFGSGPRTCLGYEVALLQMKAAIVHVARKVKLDIWDARERSQDSVTYQQKKVDISLTEEGIARPRSPILLRMEARRPQDIFRLKPNVEAEQQRVNTTESLSKEKEMLPPVAEPLIEMSHIDRDSPSNTSIYSSFYPILSAPTPYASDLPRSTVSAGYVSGTSDSSPDSYSTRGSAFITTTTSTSATSPEDGDELKPSLEELLRQEHEQMEAERLEAARLQQELEKAAVHEHLKIAKFPLDIEAGKLQGQEELEANDLQKELEANDLQKELEAKVPQTEVETHDPQIDLEAHDPQIELEAHVSQIEVEAHDLQKRLGARSEDRSEAMKSQEDIKASRSEEKLENSKLPEKSDATTLQEQEEPYKIQSDEFFDALEMTDDAAEYGHIIASYSTLESVKEEKEKEVPAEEKEATVSKPEQADLPELAPSKESPTAAAPSDQIATSTTESEEEDVGTSSGPSELTTTEEDRETESESLPTTETESLPTTETESLPTTETESLPTMEMESMTTTKDAEKHQEDEQPSGDTEQQQLASSEESREKDIVKTDQQPYMIEMAWAEEGDTAPHSASAELEPTKEITAEEGHKKRKKKKKKKDRGGVDTEEALAQTPDRIQSSQEAMDETHKEHGRENKRASGGSVTGDVLSLNGSQEVSPDIHEKRKKKKKKKDRGGTDNEEAVPPSDDLLSSLHAEHFPGMDDTYGKDKKKKKKKDKRREETEEQSPEMQSTQPELPFPTRTPSQEAVDDSHEKRKKKKKKKDKTGADTEEALPASENLVFSDDEQEKRKKKKKKKDKDRAEDEAGLVPSQSQDAEDDKGSKKRQTTDGKKVSIILTNSQLEVDHLREQMAKDTESSPSPEQTEGGEEKKKKKKKRSREGEKEKGGNTDEEAATRRRKSNDRQKELEILPWEATPEKVSNSDEKKIQGNELGEKEKPREEKVEERKRKKKRMSKDGEKDEGGTTDEDRRVPEAAPAEDGTEKKKKKKKKRETGDADTPIPQGAEGKEKKKKKKKDKQK